jgi:hypothetical protein
MEVSAGKLERVEGGSSGVPSASQALVGVVALRLSNMGESYCGVVGESSPGEGCGSATEQHG